MKVTIVFLLAMTSVLHGLDIGRILVDYQGAATKNPTVCLTPQCFQTAGELLKSIDDRLDPCDDFFQFACGRWMEHNHIPQGKIQWTQFDILDRKMNLAIKDILEAKRDPDDTKPLNSARDVYLACMNAETIEADGLEPLVRILDLLGGWPMTLKRWDKPFAWTRSSAYLLRTFGFSYLVNVYNEVDALRTNSSCIYVDQGTLSLNRDMLINLHRNAGVRSAYLKFIIETASAVSDFLKSDVHRLQIENDAQDVLLFEIQLASITSTDEERRDRHRTYNPFKLQELQQWTDSVRAKSPQAQINWFKYISTIYTNMGLTSDERVIVTEPQYLLNLMILLDVTPVRVLSNFIMWRFVMDMASDSSRRMVDLQSTFLKETGQADIEPRWTQCVRTVNDLLALAIGSKYVEESVSKETKYQIVNIVANLKEAFKNLVDDAQWMDIRTKKSAKRKADSMRTLIAYPDWIHNRTKLENYYQGIKVSRAKHFDNVRRLSSFQLAKHFAKLRQPTNYDRWIASPSTANAFYAVGYNSITLPNAVLQAPFYQRARLAAINYGAIGSIIGHEISHGFDDQGSHNDEFGNMVSWWDKETLDNYLDRAKCFADQYGGYEIESGHQLNAAATQSEDVADNVGLRQSFRAYELHVLRHGPESRLPGLEQYSPEQLFFLSFANVWCGSQPDIRLQNIVAGEAHSPHRFRVVGSLANFAPFAKHFRCRVQSRMNPDRKCVLW